MSGIMKKLLFNFILINSKEEIRRIYFLCCYTEVRTGNNSRTYNCRYRKGIGNLKKIPTESLFKINERWFEFKIVCRGKEKIIKRIESKLMYYNEGWDENVDQIFIWEL